ncbi:FAS-associated death domain protein [Rhinatrema bivittatum]|uniref:FAS-associated death domain protein n=1 Tax=Rhinatrema bivittatum TaxID=194408 RepID=UPI0011264BD8|nr:FAS-associated death domain protein [Rhinatrema bivittatum]XP_029438860.1 FAS-associated death domain protein [Rhinatrema bivittatum]
MGDFLILLHSISTDLSKEDLDHLKFLCCGIISKRKLENVKSGTDLFSILLEQQEISNGKVEFLLKMLKSLKRGDLVERLERFVENGPDDAAELPEPQEREQLKTAFLVISENVARNWKMLMRRLGVSEARLEGIMVAYPNNLQEQIIQGLRVWQKSQGKNAKVLHLLQALQDCQMKLVAELVEAKLSSPQV